MRRKNKLISMSSFIALIFLIFITYCQQTKETNYSKDKITVESTMVFWQLRIENVIS